MDKSFILEDHKDLKAGFTYYIKKGGNLKDLLFNIKEIEVLNNETVLVLSEKVLFEDIMTDRIKLADLEKKTIIQITDRQKEIPKKEFTDYLFLITNIINLKGLPLNSNKKHKEVNKVYWLCTVNGERYKVNKKKFRAYIKLFYKEHFNVNIEHFISTSSELNKTAYELNYYSFMPVADITAKVKTIKRKTKNKTKEEIQEYLEYRFKNLYYDNGKYYGVDLKRMTESQKNQYDLLKHSLCKYVFSLSAQNVDEYIKNTNKFNVLYRKYKDDSVIPLFIQCSQFVHYDKNMCRLLYKSYPFVSDNALHLSTGYVAFNIYFCDIDFESLSDEEKHKVFTVFKIKNRYEELLEKGVTRESIFYSLLEEDIDITLLQYLNIHLS